MTDTSPGSADQPVRIAIIGAGPAGFYTAEALLKSDVDCSIDIFNRFPTPFGLVREGVAPDHQSIKRVTRIYDRIATNSRVRYFGNVTFGTDITHADLKPLYDQIVYAIGAQADRRMGIRGEDLAGSLPATAFVGWYNGHPDYSNLYVDLSHPCVVVVGNGNVAMDVARILVRDPDELAQTDIADHALQQLRQSKVREVIMLGRRGPAQAAFTNAELKEFGQLSGVDIIVEPADLELDPHSIASLEDDAMARRNVETLREFAQRPLTDAPRRIVLRFLSSPVHILGEKQVTSVEVERNKLVVDDNGGLRARGTGEHETIETGLVLRSVGYRGIPLKGVPFDESSYTISNIAGRVVHSTTGEPIPGEYVVGWAKRGPSGVIGTNKPDAVSTVAAMLADIPSLPPLTRRDPQIITSLLEERGIQYVSYADWQLLDQYEQEQGQAAQRPRIKTTSVAEMLRIIREYRAR